MKLSAIGYREKEREKKKKRREIERVRK